MTNYHIGLHLTKCDNIMTKLETPPPTTHRLYTSSKLVSRHFGHFGPEPSLKSLANCGSGTVPYDVTTVRSGRHLSPQVHRSDRLFLWKLSTPIYISQPNLLSTLTITT